MPKLACFLGNGFACKPPLPEQYNGTFSITSIGGVATTFLLEWFRQLEQANGAQAECENWIPREKGLLESNNPAKCKCDALSGGAPRRHLVSCHIDDDGVFKHLADPSVLNRFPDHKAVYVVGSPMDAVSSVFRRRFQCWHLYRLNNCWFTREQKNGHIPCEQPGIHVFRSKFGNASSLCRVPPTGPLSSISQYEQVGEDLFGMNTQFRAWLSCRRPHCRFDILVLRYETLSASLPTLFDFLDVPAAARAHFPEVKAGRLSDISESRRQNLAPVYGKLEQAVQRIPAEGLLLKNT